jgi:hypothetical protein
MQLFETDQMSVLVPPEAGSEEDKAKARAKLAKALSAMDGIRKNAKNGAFAKGSYANLTAVIEGITGKLEEFGLAQVTSSITLLPGAVKYAFYVVCAETGAKILVGMSSTYASFDKQGKASNDAHATGSAETYAQRRGMLSVYSIPQEDDDGNLASGIVAPGAATPARPGGPPVHRPAGSAAARRPGPPGR